MTTWADFVAAEPGFAARVRPLLSRGRHLTLATLRRDGSPRISGTELAFEGGELVLGAMERSLKALDLLRDPRLAVHGPTEDPPEHDPSAWSGEAKLAGRAVAVPLPTGATGHRFVVDLSEVVLTGVEGGELVVESWHPGTGYRRRTRS